MDTAKTKTKTWADQVTERYFKNIEDVTADEIKCLPEAAKSKREKYLCYFLRSDTAPCRTYSGSTNDFPHRIRQHNGLISGGARMTKTTRPWRVACLIMGFPSQASALRFEFFTKTKNTKIENAKELNSLQRRAALIAAAESKMLPSIKRLLTFFLPDPYFRECVEVARNQFGALKAMLGCVTIELHVPEWHGVNMGKSKKKDEPPVLFIVLS